MNRAASRLASRKELQGGVQNGRFYRQEEGETRKLRVKCFRQGLLPLGESRGSSDADHLTNADEDMPG